MAFYDQTVEVKVHSLLTKRSYQFAFSTDMTGIAEDGQIRDAAAQFDRNVPLGQIAVNLLVVAAETTMNST